MALYKSIQMQNTGDQVGVAFNLPELKIKVGKMLNNGLSVYTGEMLALLLAVQWVEENKPLWTIICSDSSSSLASLGKSFRCQTRHFN